MSLFTDKGYTENTKFRCLKDWEAFKKGDVVMLSRDDGSCCPWFINSKGQEHCMFLPDEFGGKDLEVFIEEEKDMTPFEQAGYTKDMVFKVTGHNSLTWHELNVGDKVKLLNDDESQSPEFIRISDSKTQYVSLVDIEEVKAIKIKIKFPCCVPMSEIKDQETFDKIFALFIANGAEKYETDWEDNKDCGYNYFGVDCNKDTLFYGCVESYSFNDEEDEVTTYSVAELLGLVPKEDAIVTPVTPLTTQFPVGTASVASQEAITERLEDKPSVGIDLAEEASSSTIEPLYKVGDLVVIADLGTFNTDFVKVGDTALVIDILPNGNLWLNCSSWEYKQICCPHHVKPSGVTQSEVKEMPLVSIVKDVTYHVSIKGTSFTFTQDELNELTEELLGFSDDF